MIYIKLSEGHQKALLEILYHEKKRKQTHYELAQSVKHKKALLEEISKISDIIKAVK